MDRRLNASKRQGGHSVRDRLKVIAVGGAFGKTPTSQLIAGVLAAGGFPTAVLGKLGYSDGFEAWPLPRNCDPEAVLFDWLTRANLSGCTHAVVEASRCSLPALKRLGVMFDTACITRLSLGVDAAESDDPFEDGPFELRLFERIVPEGVAVLNADDAGCEDLLSRVDTPALTVGIDEAAEITASIVEQTICDQTFLLSAGEDAMPVRVALVGRENVYHCLLAAAVGFAHGLDIATIARGLESVECVPGRLRRVECGQPFAVFVDAADRPESLAAALAELRPLVRGRMLCVFGGERPIETFGRHQLARTLDKSSDLAVITSAADERSAGAAPAELMSAFPVTSLAQLVGDRREAIRLALNEARPGDCVLIAGRGESPWASGLNWTSDVDEARQSLYAGVTHSQRHRAAA
jgi:UDP-N-acetylmuramoyl-L-alanyl-D-glutamate--2,6-diaminopimelate ligase